ncbi:choice-of-anchor J domain-containing protein, partial [bacterium]|nr:choice-of-anchor J domain-containing protein [bacterium]
MTSVELLLWRNGSAPASTYYIASDNGGFPGDMIAGPFVRNDILPGSAAWYCFDIGNVPTIAGQTYWIVQALGPGALIGKCDQWQSAYSDVYANGGLAWDDGSGTWTLDYYFQYDLAFRTYSYGCQTLFEEGFENGGAIPGGWLNQVWGQSNPGWEFAAPDPDYAPPITSGMAWHEYTNPVIVADDFLIMPPLDLSAASSPRLVFDEAMFWPDFYEGHHLKAATVANPVKDDFASVSEMDSTGYAVREWYPRVVDVSAYQGEPVVRFAFEYQGDDADTWYIDNVRIDDHCEFGPDADADGDADAGGDCPPAGTNAWDGPRKENGFCWYLGAGGATCDTVCTGASGQNLAWIAQNALPEHCESPALSDVSTWFHRHGNAAAWFGPGPGTLYH